MSPFAYETRLLAQASSALVDLPVGADRAGQVLGDFLRRAPLLVALGVRVLVWMTPFFPLLFAGRFRLFGGLSGEERVEVWSRALTHRRWVLRQLAMLYKTIACLCAYDFDAARVG